MIVYNELILQGVKCSMQESRASFVREIAFQKGSFKPAKLHPHLIYTLITPHPDYVSFDNDRTQPFGKTHSTPSNYGNSVCCIHYLLR